MAVVLTFDNKPPLRSRILLGEQVRDVDWRAIARLNTELWANSGENLSGSVYDRTVWTTASTSFGIGSGWTLDRWQPLLISNFRHANTDQATLFCDAWVRNLDIQVQVLNTAYTVLVTITSLCTSNTPQWLSIRQLLTGLNATPNRILQVQARRSTFDVNGAFYHIGAKMGATLVAQVPIV